MNTNLKSIAFTPFLSFFLFTFSAIFVSRLQSLMHFFQVSCFMIQIYEFFVHSKENPEYFYLFIPFIIFILKNLVPKVVLLCNILGLLFQFMLFKWHHKSYRIVITFWNCFPVEQIWAKFSFSFCFASFITSLDPKFHSDVLAGDHGHLYRLQFYFVFGKYF